MRYTLLKDLAATGGLYWQIISKLLEYFLIYRSTPLCEQGDEFEFLLRKSTRFRPRLQSLPCRLEDRL